MRPSHNKDGTASQSSTNHPTSPGAATVRFVKNTCLGGYDMVDIPSKTISLFQAVISLGRGHPHGPFNNHDP